MRRYILSFAETFAVAFGLTLLTNAEHVLGARGLDTAKAAAIAALIAALRAGVLAIRVKLTST